MTNQSEPPRTPDEPPQDAKKAAPKTQKPKKIQRGLGLTREQIRATIARHPKAMKKLE